MRFTNLFTIILTALLIIGCSESAPKSLPILGKKQIVDGQEVNHKIPNWEFMNQDSAMVTNKDLSDVVYVTDVFFRSCPTICPKTMREMKRIYTEFQDNPQVKLVSFTIDPVRDTPAALKQYANNLEVDTDKWWFLHGEKEETYDQDKYLSTTTWAKAAVKQPSKHPHSRMAFILNTETKMTKIATTRISRLTQQTT